MKKYWLYLSLLLVIVIACIFIHLSGPHHDKTAHVVASAKTAAPINTIRDLLTHESKTLNKAVVDKVMAAMDCVQHYQIRFNPILTIIDYSLPSSSKRLWVFDLEHKKLLFHTYVAHGIKSGYLFTKYFSNKNNSKSSSIGVYKTDKSYWGREGLALKLSGLEQGFNDQAENRSVVMHGGWYSKKKFIQKYGRAGRSWGCPALPAYMTTRIINTIKNNSLFIVYYPDEAWFAKSKFLQCYGPYSPIPVKNSPALRIDEETEAGVAFIDLNQNNRHEENEPVIAIKADTYMQIFQTKAPLTHMLRRKIHHEEYIALTLPELDKVIKNTQNIVFVTPEVRMRRGYYITIMRTLPLGQIRELQSQESGSPTLVFTSGKNVMVKTTNQFLRWIGL